MSTKPLPCHHGLFTDPFPPKKNPFLAFFVEDFYLNCGVCFLVFASSWLDMANKWQQPNLFVKPFNHTWQTSGIKIAVQGGKWNATVVFRQNNKITSHTSIFSKLYFRQIFTTMSMLALENFKSMIISSMLPVEPYEASTTLSCTSTQMLCRYTLRHFSVQQHCWHTVHILAHWSMAVHSIRELEWRLALVAWLSEPSSTSHNPDPPRCLGG